MKINKNAGLFIRLLSTIIDVLFFCFFGIVLSLISISETTIGNFFDSDNPNISSNILNQKIYIVNNLYWLWLFLLILILFIEFILIPFFLKGRTIGMLITRLKLKYDNEKFIKVLFYRNCLGSFLWIIVIFLFMIFVSPNTINKYLLYKEINNLTIENKEEILSKINFSIWEIILFYIPSSLPSIILTIQLLSILSVMFKRKNVSIIDRFSNSLIVYKNKFIDFSNNNLEVINPEKNINIEIIWKE